MLPDRHDYTGNSYVHCDLNKLPAVHNDAVAALKFRGWQQKGEYLVRPGKDRRKGISAQFDLYPTFGIHIFTNYSSGATDFVPRKGYTDCQVLSILEYNGDYRACVQDLRLKYSYLI